MRARTGTGLGGILLTGLLSGLFGPDKPIDGSTLDLPSSAVNLDNSILSLWKSEQEYDEIPLESECQFFNFSSQYTDELCDPFAISRIPTSSLRTASGRALKCAAKAKTDCVLSAEIGFSAPAAFIVAPELDAGVRAIIAPRIIGFTKQSIENRVNVIDLNKLTAKTVLMQNEITIEYLTDSKTVETDTFYGPDAFCVAFLRLAFIQPCWHKLDG